MKILEYTLIMSFCIVSPFINAQNKKQPQADTNLVFGKCDTCPYPLLVYNNIISTKELKDINPNMIGIIFEEGDSAYLSRANGNNPDTSLIRKYFGKERNKGILFIYTKEKVQDISQKKFEEFLKNKKQKMLYKVDNEPLTDYYNKTGAEQIQMVKNFKLQYWDTGVIDTFTLFVIKTKK